MWRGIANGDESSTPAEGTDGTSWLGVPALVRTSLSVLVDGHVEQRKRIDALYAELTSRSASDLELRATLATLCDGLHHMAADNAALAVSVERSNGRCAHLAAELGSFRAESQAGIVAATRAANEAREAVSSALAAVASSLSTIVAAGSASDGGIGLQLTDYVAALRAEVDSLRDAVSTKADVAAVNEALHTKANKLTVAVALRGKLSQSRISEQLGPLSSRIAAIEAEMGMLLSVGTSTTATAALTGSTSADHFEASSPAAAAAAATDTEKSRMLDRIEALEGA